MTLALLVGGARLLWPGTPLAAKLAGALALVVLIVVQPLRRPRRSSPGLLGANRPATRDLITDIATLVGSPVPTRIGINGDINASVSARGLRTRVLVVGAPLWEAASRQERVALLAHELGHLAHADVTQLRFVIAALDSLENWIGLFSPHLTARSAMIVTRDVMRLLTAPLRAAVEGYGRLILLASGPSHRRQEHYADLASAAVAGTAAAISMLELLLATEAIDVAIRRGAARTSGIAAALSAFRTGFDAEERASARRRGDERSSRIDDSHPPTMERIRLLESMPAMPAGYVPDDAAWNAIDAEWAAPIGRQLKLVANEFRFG